MRAPRGFGSAAIVRRVSAEAEKLRIASGPCQLSQFSRCSAASEISNRNDAECPCHRDLEDGQAEVWWL
jgi:hypothetical protein